MTTEDLEAAQLVARVGDSGGAVRTEHVELLELPDHGGAEVGDGGADPRQDRVVLGEQLLPVVEIRAPLLKVDHELEGVEDLDVDAALLGGLTQATGAVAVGATREDSELHLSFSLVIDRRPGHGPTVAFGT